MPQQPARHETTRDQNMNASDRPQQPAAAELEATRLRGLSESDRTLLVVDDDAPLCQRLARAMERRGFVVATADSVANGVAAATAQPPAFAVVDLRLGEPYLSTRAGASNHMGLGIFIAQSLLERSGAELTFDNLVEGGAHVVISWIRANLETEARSNAAAVNAAGA